jgi:TPR repeat protein
MNRSRIFTAVLALASGAVLATASRTVAAEPTAEALLARAYETLACSAYADAMPQLLRAAEAGSAEAQEIVGWLYLAGETVDGGIARDESQALRWLRHAAEAGRPDAQQRLVALELEALRGGRPALAQRSTLLREGE